jgi:hypothetical protein
LRTTRPPGTIEHSWRQVIDGRRTGFAQGAGLIAFASMKSGRPDLYDFIKRKLRRGSTKTGAGAREFFQSSRFAIHRRVLTVDRAILAALIVAA